MALMPKMGADACRTEGQPPSSTWQEPDTSPARTLARLPTSLTTLGLRSPDNARDWVFSPSVSPTT